MKFSFKIVMLLFIIPFSQAAFANLNLITWKGTYYNAIPNKKNISSAYCKAHTPGSFIHVVRKPIGRTFITNKKIKLYRGTFHSKKQHGFYILYGDFWASGKTHKKLWHDHIFWHLTKLTEAGLSHGVWSSGECKGFYLGVAIKNKNKKLFSQSPVHKKHKRNRA